MRDKNAPPGLRLPSFRFCSVLSLFTYLLFFFLLLFTCFNAMKLKKKKRSMDV